MTSVSAGGMVSLIQKTVDKEICRLQNDFVVLKNATTLFPQEKRKWPFYAFKRHSEARKGLPSVSFIALSFPLPYAFFF